MKKSIYNIFRKIDGESDTVFNSYSLALAEADQDFYKIYDNLDNIDLNNLNENEKKTFKEMYNCNFIVNDETDEKKNLEFIRSKSMYESGVVDLTIGTTLSCNFDCNYCYEKNKKGIISKEVQEKIIELIKEKAERKLDINIAWIGGEPLLTFDIINNMSKKIINICNENKVKYSSLIITNGYLFNDSIISKLKECKITSVQVTFDGPPEVHNKKRYLKRNKEGTFDVILKNVKKIIRNKINVVIRVNIDINANEEEIVELIRILEKNDLLNNFYISKEFDLNFNACTRKSCHSFEGFAKFSINFYKKLDQLGIKFLNQKSYYPKYMPNICAATMINTLCIDPDGFIYKCPLELGEPEKATGNILKFSQHNLTFLNNEIKYRTWDPFKFKKCVDCNLLPMCLSGCPIEGLAHNEPQCIEWKYSIEELIDTIAVNSKNEVKVTD